MLLALLFVTSWPLFSKMDGFKSKRFTAEHHKGPHYMAQQQYSVRYRLISPFITRNEECRRDLYTAANLLHLGRTSLARSWMWSTATSEDFPPSLQKDVAAREFTLGFAFFDQMLCCHTAQNSSQQGRCDLCQYYGMFDLFFIYNTHLDCGFWHLTLFPDQ